MLAHSVVVLQHVFVGLQAKFVVVSGALAKADRLVLVHDTAHFDDLAWLQTEFWLVPQYLYVLVLMRLHDQLSFVHIGYLAHECDGLADELGHVLR